MSAVDRHPPADATKIVFVGQGPNQTAWNHGIKTARRLNPAREDANCHVWAVRYCARVAITGAIGKKIAALAGFDVANREELRFYARYARRNLNTCWYGKAGKGDYFDREEALATAKLLAADPAWTHYVLLGKEVARAFGVSADFLEVRFDKTVGKNFLVFPHPSGLSTWWNDEFNAFRAKKRLRQFLETK